VGRNTSRRSIVGDIALADIATHLKALTGELASSEQIWNKHAVMLTHIMKHRYTEC
jgi:hypothetical protein